MEAEEEKRFTDQVTQLLEGANIPNGVAMSNADSLLRKARRPFSFKGERFPVLPLSQWFSAVNKAVAISSQQNGSTDLMGLIVSLVPDADLQPITIIPSTPEDRKAAEAAERAARNDRIIAAAWGGVSA